MTSPNQKQNSLNLLSIVIPLYNEGEVFSHLYQRLCELTDQLGEISIELIFVDDGSSDSTWNQICAAGDTDPRIRAVSLSRNFGQQIAFSAGLDLVRGDAAVLMDGDLQDDPSIVLELVQKFKDGFDVVSVKRFAREASFALKAAYSTFYRLFHLLSPLKITLDSGDFSIISRRVVNCLKAMPERHRFLRGLRSWVGFRQTSIEVVRPARLSGDSKFTFSKLCGLATDGLLSFSIIPLRLTLLAGTVIVCFALVMSAYWLYVKLTSDSTPTGFTAIISFVCLIGGANLMFLGVIGEYVGRIYEQCKGRPLYLIQDSQGMDREGESGALVSTCPYCMQKKTR